MRRLPPYSVWINVNALNIKIRSTSACISGCFIFIPCCRSGCGRSHIGQSLYLELLLLSHHTVVWGYLVYCVFVSFCLFVCTVTDFSAAEKGRDVKFCTRVQLVSRQVFSHFGELCLTWSYGGGITSGMSHIEIAIGQSELGAVAGWAFGTGGSGVL